MLILENYIGLLAKVWIIMGFVFSLLVQQTDLKRRQAIKVKRSPSNRSLNTSITTRIRMKAREAKEDIQGDAGHTAAYQEGGGQ